MTTSIWIVSSLVVGLAARPAAADTPPAAADPRASAADAPGMAPLPRYLIADRGAEIALARSAAPPSISANATVMVLTPRGYEVAATGKNGFVCLVERSWQGALDDPQFWNPKIRSPICFNPPAVRSVLPGELKQVGFALMRLAQAEILARMTAAVARKELGPPEAGALSYMMSKDQYLNDKDTHWHPHVMLYLPSTVDDQAIGANLPGSPVLGGQPELPGGGRMPATVFFVPVGRWSDGSDAPGHAGH